MLFGVCPGIVEIWKNATEATIRQLLLTWCRSSSVGHYPIHLDLILGDIVDLFAKLVPIPVVSTHSSAW